MVVGQVGVGCRTTRRTRKSSSGESLRQLHAVLRRAALLATAATIPWLAGACATTVAMAEVQGPSPDQPHSTILYSGVHDATRRFPDYSVVDRAILKGKRR